MKEEGYAIVSAAEFDSGDIGKYVAEVPIEIVPFLVAATFPYMTRVVNVGSMVIMLPE